MAENTNSHEKRKQIVDAALIEFYDFGYNDASLNRVAKNCNLSKGALYYYFQSKNNLASSVYMKIGKDVADVVSMKIMINCPSFNLQYSNAISSYLWFDNLCQDKKAGRFFKEYYDTNFCEIYNQQTVTVPFYQMHNSAYNLNLSEDDIKLLTATTDAAQVAATLLYVAGELKTTRYEEVRNKIMRIPFENLKLPEADITEIIEESNQLVQKLDFKILPYFKIE